MMLLGFGVGLPELLIILVIILIIFGAGKLPQIGESFGKALKNFKRAQTGADEIDVTPPQEAKAEEIDAKKKAPEIAEEKKKSAAEIEDAKIVEEKVEAKKPEEKTAGDASAKKES
jgi:sec-independent protein translocase protein TatA